MSFSQFELKSSQSVLKANTRQVGEIRNIELLKSTNGLGFTISSRDTMTSGVSPLIINRILPGGSAIQSDLKIGDRYEPFYIFELLNVYLLLKKFHHFGNFFFIIF